MSPTFQNRPVHSLLGHTPVRSVTASAAGILVLGDDARYTTRFERYAREPAVVHAHTLEARIRTHQPGRATLTGPDAPLRLNLVQTSMYRRVLYGLREYTPAQLLGMNEHEKARVVRDHQKCDQVLHRLKCDRYFEKANRLLNAIWPALAIGTKTSDYMVKLPAEVTLNRLKITTREIVAALIGQKLLPRTFLELGQDTLQLR